MGNDNKIVRSKINNTAPPSRNFERGAIVRAGYHVRERLSKIRGPPKRRLRDLFQACAHAALPDFLTFRQPSSYQKLPLVVH